MVVRVCWKTPEACASMSEATGLICTSNAVPVTETETGGDPDGAIDGVGLGALV